MHRIKKKQKTGVLCGSLPIEQMHNEYAVSQIEAATGFVIGVVPIPLNMSSCER